jgi:hypothetical protein
VALTQHCSVLFKAALPVWMALAVSQSRCFAAEMAALAEESDTTDAASAAGSGAGGSAVTSRLRSAPCRHQACAISLQVVCPHSY